MVNAQLDELERQLTHLRPLVSDIILPEIQGLPKQDLMGMAKTLCPLLISLTLVESLEIREANAELLKHIFEELTQ